MNVMLVGGAGYIGTALTKRLMEDHKVTILDTFMFGDFLPEGCTKIIKNAGNTSKEDYQEQDVVIFLAGLSNDPMSEFMPKECFIQNAAMPGYVAWLCKNAGVRHFIYASTCSVYGWSPDKERTPEDEITVSYPYGLSKYMGEQGVLALHDDFFSVTAIRMGTVCGYSPKMRFDLLLNTMYKNIITQNKITVSHPDICRPILAMEDLVEIYAQVIDYQTVGLHNAVSFNVSLGELARSLVDYATDILDKRPILEVNFVGDLRNYSAVHSKVLYSPERCEADIMDTLHENGPYDFNDPRYYNALMFKKLIAEGTYE